jgi:hypothetical protein
MVIHKGAREMLREVELVFLPLVLYIGAEVDCGLLGTYYQDFRRGISSLRSDSSG